jgi:hypothetical protein
MHAGVSGVDQPIEVATVPTHHEIKSSVEGLGNAAHRPNRNVRERAALNAGDHRRRCSCSRSDVNLAELLAMADRPERCAHPVVIHRQ